MTVLARLDLEVHPNELCADHTPVVVPARRLLGPRVAGVRYSPLREHRVLLRLDHRRDLDPLVGTGCVNV